MREKGRLQTEAQKGHPPSRSIFITTGKPGATGHAPGFHAHTARKLKCMYSRGNVCTKQQYTSSAGSLDIAIGASGWNAASATPNKRDVDNAPPPPPLALSFFFFFFGVSDRLIKDYNLSSSEGQRIGLAISNLIFFQVAAKLTFVLPNKMISPIPAA